jgi:serine/threonine protein phosphatase PrpC
LRVTELRHELRQTSSVNRKYNVQQGWQVSLAKALQIGALSDAGKVRQHNEDCLSASAHTGMIVLADGMGGYNAGEVASGLATTLLVRGIEAAWPALACKLPREQGKRRAEQLLSDEIQLVNEAIYRKAHSDPRCAGMGTTLVAGLFHDNFLAVAHIGDSRLYRLRGQSFIQVTRDHSLLQEQLDSGLISIEEARHSHNRNFVTRALGVDAVAEPEINCYDVVPGDVYLFCSDGLNDPLDDEAIRGMLLQLGSQPEIAARQLVQAANDNGGRDNISVVVVKVLCDFDIKSNDRVNQLSDQ